MACHPEQNGLLWPRPAPRLGAALSLAWREESGLAGCAGGPKARGGCVPPRRRQLCLGALLTRRGWRPDSLLIQALRQRGVTELRKRPVAEFRSPQLFCKVQQRLKEAVGDLGGSAPVWRAAAPRPRPIRPPARPASPPASPPIRRRAASSLQPRSKAWATLGRPALAGRPHGPCIPHSR